MSPEIDNRSTTVMLPGKKQDVNVAAHRKKVDSGLLSHKAPKITLRTNRFFQYSILYIIFVVL